MTPRRARPGQLGFTLVEVLVALAIGIVILTAMAVLFANNSGNQGELERTTRQVENARFALDLLSEDVMHGGYYGAFNPDGIPVTYANPAAGPCPAAVADLGWSLPAVGPQLATPLQGLSAATATAAACLSGQSHLSGTEALIVRHAETGNALTPATVVAGNLYVQTSRCPSNNQIDPAEKRVALVGSASGEFILPALDCINKNDEVRRVVHRTYFIASCNDCAASDGVPTLKRNEWVNGALTVTALAEGIENLQFEYGLDTNSDGQPDSYQAVGGITGVAPAVWENVVTVRIHLLARNTEATAGYAGARTYRLGAATTVTPTDSFKRTLMTTTVRVNNVAGRREK
jgi:type IV pilus assembly protein PilW